MSFDKRRKDYHFSSLREEDADRDPIRQFQEWFDEAVAGGVAEVDAFTLATATQDGRPSARMLLLRGVDERGFTFFTNYESRKARELESNPRAAMVFFWQGMERQVRIEGRVERVSAEESDHYFHSRPVGSRLGAWASPQSQVIAGRDALEAAYQETQAQYESGDVPRPPHRGGYRLVPDLIEFWQGRLSRLHDRLRYARQLDGSWLVERLAP